MHERASTLITVTTPAGHEGVGRALRAAFRGNVERLPPDLEECLARLR